jgi:general secretion pathway protein F
VPRFHYRATTRAGEIIAGEIEASSRQEVARRVEYLGHLLIDAKLATKGLFGESWLTRKAPAFREVTVLLRQLALLARAGLTLEAALQTLTDDTTRSLARFASAVRSSIAAGDSFAEALERHPTIIEPAYVAMVRAGEASGKLESVLRAIVDDRNRRELLAERFNAAIRYPLFLIASAILILLSFLIYVVPQFEPVFTEMGGRLNAGAAFILGASTWLRTNFDFLLGACLIVVLLSWLVLIKRERRARILALLGSIPGIAGPMRDRRSARIIGILGLLVQNGVPLPMTLKILRDVLTEPRLVAGMERLHDEVRNGRRFGDALADAGVVPALAVRMLRVGDETGDLASIAAHAAQFYEHKMGVGLDRLMGAIGPVTIIVVSLLIGALIISIMSALLSITELAL